MGLNGNRFKPSAHSQPCPECLGYPPLKPKDGRLVPACEKCGGLGSVPSAVVPGTQTKSGSCLAVGGQNLDRSGRLDLVADFLEVPDLEEPVLVQVRQNPDLGNLLGREQVHEPVPDLACRLELDVC